MKLDLSYNPWATNATVVGLFRALDHQCRFVGGAVRNGLLKIKVADVDIATPLTPDEVTKRLNAAGFEIVPTGIAHGTVTAVKGKQTYELTTLRKDMSTDGRQATIEYTKDWKLDAGRRDFTINAMYADIDGNVYDYFDGIGDLLHGVIRFVGDPQDRIKEDYLRILRYYRFEAYYGGGRRVMSGPIKDAIKANMDGIKSLSGERIAAETLKLLAAPMPQYALAEMEIDGVTPLIFMGKVNRTRLIAHVNAQDDCEPIGRLLAYIDGHDGIAERIIERWKVSNDVAKRLRFVCNAGKGENMLSLPWNIRRLVYKLGRDKAIAFLKFKRSDNSFDGADEIAKALQQYAEKVQLPKFPLNGKDVIAAGIDQGPYIGKTLHALEEWWINNDFPIDQTELREHLATAVTLWKEQQQTAETVG